MKKIMYFAAIAAMSMMAVSCSGSKSADAAEQEEATVAEAAEAPAAGVVVLTDDNAFRPDKAVDDVTVLDFNATWCVPCKKLTPAYHKAAEAYEGKVKFFSVDIDSLPLTKDAFEVTQVPTVIILTPSGKTVRTESLGDFITPEQMAAAQSADEMTDIIYGSLAKMIDDNK